MSDHICWSAKKIEKKPEVIPVCVNKECAHFDVKVNTQFCAHCGHEISHKTIERTVEKGIHDITNESKFVDQLVTVHVDEIHSDGLKDKHILIPNNYIPDGIRLDDDNASITEIIFDDRVTREIGWFFSRYTEVLSAIVKEYGEDNIEVKWGIVAYWS